MIDYLYKQHPPKGFNMTTKYQLDPAHSIASFSIKHMMIAKVHGSFQKISGELIYNSEAPEKSQIEASIDVASINTNEPQRDTHLKSADFFDVEKFPQILFKSQEIMKSKSGDLIVKGLLTIHGVTQSVQLDVEGPSAEMKDPWGNIKIGASAKTSIKRKDFGLTWNAALEAGGFLVGEDVTINLDVQFVKVNT